MAAVGEESAVEDMTAEDGLDLLPLRAMTRGGADDDDDAEGTAHGEDLEVRINKEPY